MEVKLIECKDITVPKTDKSLRTFNKEFALNLAGAIEVEGQIVPAVVRPEAGQPGRYVMVDGRHRFYALKNVLKEQFIQCKVLDIDATDHEMLMISANLWRNPLTKNQHGASVKKWYDYFAAKNPDQIGRRFSAKVGADARRAKAEAAREGGDGGATAGTADDQAASGAAKGAADVLAAAAGTSKRQAEREIRLARAFDAEQTEALDQMQVKQEDRETIARIKDEADRGAVVNLIASGMEPADAIKEVLKDKAPTAAAGSRQEARQAAKAAAKDKAPAMDDETWFATYCGEKAALLADPAKYKADALLFRKVVDERAGFRARVKKLVKATRDGKVFGAFTNNLHRLLGISHPKDWFLCGSCGGKGTDPAGNGQKCPKCYGSCYEVKTEEYL
jgi:hypothetical protein